MEAVASRLRQIDKINRAIVFQQRYQLGSLVRITNPDHLWRYQILLLLVMCAQ